MCMITFHPNSSQSDQLILVLVRQIIEAQTLTVSNPQLSRLTSLPAELLLEILSNLSAFDRASLALTCHSFARFASHFSLLNFTFHLPRHSFPDSPDLLTYEDALTDFLLRLGKDWTKSSSASSECIRFCPSCAKFMSRDKDYWHDKALTHMVRGGGVEGGKWRRACQHFGGTYPLEAWIEKWCNEDDCCNDFKDCNTTNNNNCNSKPAFLTRNSSSISVKNGVTGASRCGKSKACCPRCKVLASSG